MDGSSIGKREKDYQIVEQIELLRSSGGRLSGRLSDLLSRLSPALRESTSTLTPDDAKAQPDEQLVQLASYIREIRHQTESDIRQITDILDRLEI